MENTHQHHEQLPGGVQKVFLVWVGVLALSFGFAFLVGQQVLRMSANDPQTEIMASFYESLSQGQDPSLFGSIPPVDMAKDLTPFVNIYDSEGKFVAGNGQLDGSNPSPLKGSLATAKQKGEVSFTWSPKAGVRIAAILKPYKAGEKEGYILTGKSLKIAQGRIANLMKIAVLGFVVSVLVLWAMLNLLGYTKHTLPHKADHT
jgi:hypothetical protein